MKLVKVKFNRSGESYIYLGDNELRNHDAVLCRTTGGIFAGEVIGKPDESILTSNTGAYIPLKECTIINNEIIHELWQELWDKQSKEKEKAAK